MEASDRSRPLRKHLGRTAQALVMGGLCLGMGDGQSGRAAHPLRTPEQAAFEEHIRWRREPWYRQPGVWSGGATRRAGWL